MQESEQVIQILGCRRDDGRSLIDLIRNGEWDAVFFKEVTTRLVDLPKRIPDPLSPKALNMVLATIVVAYFNGAKWSSKFKSLSPERASLDHLIDAIWVLADKWDGGS